MPDAPGDCGLHAARSGGGGVRRSARERHVPGGLADAERHRLRARDLHRSSARRRLRQGRTNVFARTLEAGQAAAGLPAAAEARRVLQGRHRGGAQRRAGPLRQIVRAALAGGCRCVPRRTSRPARCAMRACRSPTGSRSCVYPLFQQACFADPVYGGNRDKVFWKMIGYPGPAGVSCTGHGAVPRQAVSRAHRRPQSIQDFS